MYEKLRAWFDTFNADPFTTEIVGALVDVAESAAVVFDGHQSTDDDLSETAREAIEALEYLETALEDAVPAGEDLVALAEKLHEDLR